ncbi:HET-domain-containing protein [Xylaria cf. heliscus]|nr:HET-domain-containing protein [Xylaria cf. heliscus]
MASDAIFASASHWLSDTRPKQALLGHLFKYQPLDIADKQIRLLDLRPNSGRISCYLRPVSLYQLEDSYETLSYCWGLPTTRQVKISVNDFDFLVTTNLHAALLRLRQLDYNRPKTLWIDSICIDQSDDIEKREQVALMGDIYSLSQRVFIWIGEHDALTEYAFRGLTFLAARAKTGKRFHNYNWKYVRQSKNWDRITSRNPVNLDAVVSGVAFSALFSRPWFRRVWVIQEVALSPQAVVVCGKFQIDWHTIAKAYSISETNFDVNNHLGTMLRFQAWPEDLANDIFSLVIMASHQEATKPRDRIYGLLGIDHIHHNQPIIKIDYTKESDDMQIFIEFTRAYLERTRNLQVLAICRGCKNRDTSQEVYPSWAIDPTYEAKKEPLASDQISWRFTNWEAYPRGFRAGGSIQCNLTFSGNSLGVQGFQFDAVAACSPVNSPGPPQYKEAVASAGGPLWASAAAFYSIYLKNGLSSWQSALSFCQFYLASKKMCEDAGLGGTYLPTSQATLDAFWQVIRGPSLPVDHPNAEASARKQFKDFDEMLWRKAGSSIGVKSSVSIICAVLGNSIYMELLSIIGITRHRRFFITKNGYMGLGPRDTKIGDSIILLQGHQAPILARAAAGTHWKVVGDSYVHGIMDGSVFKPEKCELVWLD